MAWKYKITRVDFEPGNPAIGVEVRIYKDSWTGGDKVIVRYYQLAPADATAANILSNVNADIAMFNNIKAAQSTLLALVDVENTVA